MIVQEDNNDHMYIQESSTHKIPSVKSQALSLHHIHTPGTKPRFEFGSHMDKSQKQSTDSQDFGKIDVSSIFKIRLCSNFTN